VRWEEDTKPKRSDPRPAAEGSPPEPFLAGRRGLRLLLLGGLTVLTLLPFTGKAFHIDDPMYIWAGKRIHVTPLDPYGLEVNWYGFQMRMSEVNKNPPLTSYYMAGIAWFFGWGERVLHIAFLLPAIIVIIGTYLLAERLCRRPLLAAFCALFTPVFLVSSTNVMSDVLMLAFWMMAAHLWFAGLERGSAWRLLLSAFLVALSALAKYYGMALVPLLLIYTVAKQRRLTWALACFLVPAGLLLGYQVATHAIYGRGLLLDAASYATALPSQWGKWSVAKLLIGLAFAGGCIGAVWLFALWTWPRWTWLVGGVVAGVVIATTATYGTIGGNPMGVSAGNVGNAAVLLGVFAVGGLVVLGLAVRQAVETRDAESWFLCMWVLGTFAFAALVNWTTNGRSILPMAPAVAILIARGMPRIRAKEPGGRAGERAVLGAIAVCSVLVAVGATWADFIYANSARAAARDIDHRYTSPSRALWFEGHWGFQYYMEAKGGTAINFSTSKAKPGDLLVVPENNSNIHIPTQAWTTLIDTLEVPTSRWIATMRTELGAGFYADVIGPLPFAVGNVTPERYFIFRVTR